VKFDIAEAVEDDQSRNLTGRIGRNTGDPGTVGASKILPAGGIMRQSKPKTSPDLLKAVKFRSSRRQILIEIVMIINPARPDPSEKAHSFVPQMRFSGDSMFKRQYFGRPGQIAFVRRSQRLTEYGFQRHWLTVGNDLPHIQQF
jgi:hypothetical protein